MSRICTLILSLILTVSLGARETDWGTIYDPTLLEIAEDRGAINLQEMAYFEARKAFNTDRAYHMAVYPIQRAYAILEIARDNDNIKTWQSYHQTQYTLKWAYRTLAKGDGLPHGTEGEDFLHNKLDEYWLSVQELLYPEK